jgi:hypothetical protein
VRDHTEGTSVAVVGPAFRAADRQDLERLAWATGAIVRPLRGPGGEAVVNLQDRPGCGSGLCRGGAFADGDMFDNAVEIGWSQMSASTLAQWGPPVTRAFLGATPSAS